MSEEILEHLMNLFGILAKQGGGASEVEMDFVRKFLSDQIASAKVEEYLEKFKEKAAERGKMFNTENTVKAVEDMLQNL